MSGHTSAESRARAQESRARCGTRASRCSTSPRASKNHRAGQKTTVARCGFWVFKKGPSPTGVGWSGSRKESHVGSSWPIAPLHLHLCGYEVRELKRWDSLPKSVLLRVDRESLLLRLRQRVRLLRSLQSIWRTAGSVNPQLLHFVNKGSTLQIKLLRCSFRAADYPTDRLKCEQNEITF